MEDEVEDIKERLKQMTDKKTLEEQVKLLAERVEKIEKSRKLERNGEVLTDFECKLEERVEALEALCKPLIASNLDDLQNQIDDIRAKKNEK